MNGPCCVTLGAKPPSLEEIIEIALSPIPPVVIIDGPLFDSLEKEWARSAAAGETDEGWLPPMSPVKQATMPTGGLVGVGDASIPCVDRAVVRATVVIRLLTLLKPQTVVRPVVLKTLVELLNDNALPPIQLAWSDEKALNQILRSVAQCHSSKGGDHSNQGAESFFSEAEGAAFVSGTAFTVARTLITLEVARVCSMFADCSSALLADASGVPLQFPDPSEFVGGKQTHQPYGFPGAVRSLKHMRELFEASKVKRLSPNEIDSEIIQDLASVPLYSGALWDRVEPLASLIKAELCCCTGSTNSEAKAVVCHPSIGARIDILGGSVQSLVEIMGRLALTLLGIVEKYLPVYRRRISSSPIPSPLPIPEGFDPLTVPLEANPISEESYERLVTRLPPVRQAIYQLLGQRADTHRLVCPGEQNEKLPFNRRGEEMGACLIEALLLLSCAAIQISSDAEVSLYLEAVEKAKTKKKIMPTKLALGRGTSTFREFILDLIDRRTPPNQRGQMISHCESILHAELGKIGLINPLVSNTITSILTPSNQGTRIPKVPKGTQDVTPLRMAIREHIFSKIRSVFDSAGAVQIDTPVFELKETLVGKYGEDQKLIYDLKDQGGEQLSLRYDLTVPLARYVATHNVDRMKRYHIAKVYRRDEPQMNRGRYREFYQCDIDYIGGGDPLVADADILVTIVECLKQMEDVLGPFTVKMSHRVILDGILRVAGVPAASTRAISSAVDKLDKETWETVRNEMILQKGLDASSADDIYKYITMGGTTDEIINQLSADEKLGNMDCVKGAVEEVRTLLSYLDSCGVAKYFKFDLSLARGLDYYTGLIYEVVLVGANVGSIAAGGRYDHLIGAFSGRLVPAVGCSLGIERILRLYENAMNLTESVPIEDESTGGKANSSNAKKKSPAKKIPEHQAIGRVASHVVKERQTEVFVCSIGASTMCKRVEVCMLLRRHGIPAEYAYEAKAKLVKQLNMANKYRVPVAVIFGEDEIAKSTVNVKTFTYGDTTSTSDAATVGGQKEQEVALPDLCAKVRSIIGRPGGGIGSGQ